MFWGRSQGSDMGVSNQAGEHESMEVGLDYGRTLFGTSGRLWKQELCSSMLAILKVY